MRKIGDWEFIDHGVDGAQYFPGCGCANTQYEYCATGCGSTPAEAVDDLLESVAQDDFETEGMEKAILADCGLAEFPDTDCCSECEYSECDDDDEKDAACQECELNYYVSLRWNDADADPTEPDEDAGDIVIGQDDTSAYQYGKCIVRVDEPDELRPAIKAHMEAAEFWPNVWTVSDHGNACLITPDVMAQ